MSEVTGENVLQVFPHVLNIYLSQPPLPPLPPTPSFPSSSPSFFSELFTYFPPHLPSQRHLSLPLHFLTITLHTILSSFPPFSHSVLLLLPIFFYVSSNVPLPSFPCSSFSCLFLHSSSSFYDLIFSRFQCSSFPNSSLPSALLLSFSFFSYFPIFYAFSSFLFFSFSFL